MFCGTYCWSGQDWLCLGFVFGYYSSKIVFWIKRKRDCIFRKVYRKADLTFLVTSLTACSHWPSDFFCIWHRIRYLKEMGIEPNAIFIGNWIWIGIEAVCHLPVCYIQPIYLSESERKSDGQCEQAVKIPSMEPAAFKILLRSQIDLRGVSSFASQCKGPFTSSDCDVAVTLLRNQFCCFGVVLLYPAFATVTTTKLPVTGESLWNPFGRKVAATSQTRHRRWM